MQNSINWRRFGWIVGILIAVFLVFFLLLHHQVSESRQAESALRITLSRMEEQNKEMNAELSLVGTEDYIVTSAMTNYAFMNKNDLRFQFVNPEALYAYTESELKILMDEMAD